MTSHNERCRRRLAIGDQVLMGGDVATDRYEEPRVFSLSIQIKSAADAERISLSTTA